MRKAKLPKKINTVDDLLGQDDGLGVIFRALNENRDKIKKCLFIYETEDNFYCEVSERTDLKDVLLLMEAIKVVIIEKFRGLV